MKKLKIIKRCLLVDANAFFTRKYPFAQYCVYRSHHNQMGFDLQQDVRETSVRLDGWIYTSDLNLKKMLDVVVEIAKGHGCSKIYYFDRISEERAMPLIGFGFKEKNGYMTDRLFEMEVE